jgi:hypothetical protein
MMRGVMLSARDKDWRPVQTEEEGDRGEDGGGRSAEIAVDNGDDEAVRSRSGEGVFAATKQSQMRPNPREKALRIMFAGCCSKRLRTKLE